MAVGSGGQVVWGACINSRSVSGCGFKPRRCLVARHSPTTGGIGDMMIDDMWNCIYGYMWKYTGHMGGK